MKKIIILFCVAIGSNKISGQNIQRVDSLILRVSNENIDWATFRPQGAKTVLLERRIEILGPPEAVRLFNMGKEIAPALISSLNDETKDWAMHLILSAIYNYDTHLILHYYKDRQRWRSKYKTQEVKYWAEEISKK